MAQKSELLTAVEVCERLKISRMSLHNWRREKGFPEPLTGPGKKAILRWYWHEIEAWLRNDKR